MTISRIPTTNHSQWLQERKKGIGGSDAAAVLGLNPYVSPFALWAEKTGRLPEQADNERMRQGRDLEEYVAQRFAEKSGKKVRRCNYILKNSAFPFALANPDRLIVGETEGLECKTTSILGLKRFRNGEFPETHYCQCVHYLAVTELKRWYLAVLVLNEGFYIYQITRIPNDPKPEWCESSVYVDDREIQALMDAEEEFWQYVSHDTEPPVDGMEATSEALDVIYQNPSPGLEIDLYGTNSTVERYLDAKAFLRQAEASLKLVEQEIKAQMGEAEIGRTERFRVNWKKQRRRTFDHKRFAQDHPDVDLEQYFNTSEFRKFDIKELK